MTSADAIRLVQMLGSAFRQDVSEETAVQWAADLAAFELSDALEAVELTRKTQVFMPSLAEFLAIVRDCRNTRVVMDRASLPSAKTCCDGQGFGHFYRDHADAEMRARVDRLLQVPQRARPEETMILEAFAKVVGS